MVQSVCDMPTTDDRRSAPRISLPITEDGLSVDWAHVRPSVAAKFESLLRTDSKIKEAYEEENGISNDPGVDPFGGVTQENVHALLDTIGKANGLIFQMVAGKWIKHPFLKNAATDKPVNLIIDPDLVKMMGFTPKQHEELDPRATKIAQRYSGRLPKWLRENMDLYMFGYMFIAYTAENAKTVLQLQIQRDIQRIEAQYAQQQAKQKRPVDSDVPKSNGVDQHPPSEFAGFESIGGNEAPSA